MIKRALTAIAVVLAGCSEATQGGAPAQGTEQDEAQLVRQLERSDGAACANPRVQEAIRHLTVEPENLYRYSGWSESERAAFEAALDVRVTNIGLNSIDPVTKLISCTGNYVATYDGQGGSAPIIFDIKPSLDDSGPLFRVQDTQTTWNVLLSARQAFENQRQAAEQAQRDLVPASRNFDEARRICQRSAGSPESIRYAVNFMREVPERPADWFDGQTWQCMKTIATPASSRSATAPPVAAPSSPSDEARATIETTANPEAANAPNTRRFSLPVTEPTSTTPPTAEE